MLKADYNEFNVEVDSYFMLGAVRVLHTVEDRYIGTENPQKYKHCISVYLLGIKVYSSVLRSHGVGYISRKTNLFSKTTEN